MKPKDEKADADFLKNAQDPKGKNLDRCGAAYGVKRRRRFFIFRESDQRYMAHIIAVMFAGRPR